MPLSWNEIKDRASRFTREWADEAADAAYFVAEKHAGRKPPKTTTDAERVAFLFECYQALTSLLPTTKPRKSRRTSTKTAAT